MVIIHDEVEYDMNKLVLLKDIKKDSRIIKEKTELKINNIINKDYTNFKEKFCGNLNGKINDINCNINDIAKIIKNLFLIDNKQPFVDLINFLYDDCLGTNISINFNDEDDNRANFIILSVSDDYRKFLYEIFIQSYDDSNIALYIKKEQINETFKNVVNFNMKKNQYKKACDSEEDSQDIKENNNFKIIVIDSDIEVPELLEVEVNQENELKKYKLDILKSWKYDFKKLIENNIYFLFPLKIFDLKKRINVLIELGYSQEFLKEEVARFFNELNSSLYRIKYKGIINDKEIDYINIITMQLFELFIKERINDM